jgi:hypothetical protein
LAALLLAPAVARADGKRDLEDGIAFYENLDTEHAIARLKAASEAPDLGPAERAKAFLYLGIVQFETGDSKDADQSWKKSFALDAAIAVPAGTSPKVIQAIEASRKDAKKSPAPTPLVGPGPTGATGPSGPASSGAGGGSATGAGGGAAGGDKKPPSGPDSKPPGPALTEPAPTPASADDDSGGGIGWILWAAVGVAVIGAAAVGFVLLNHSDCQGGGGCAQVDVMLR